MPVQFDSYGRGTVRSQTDGGDAEKVLRFLRSNPELGYTPREIHDGTGIPRESVGGVLAELRSRGLVQHKRPYWSVRDVSDRRV